MAITSPIPIPSLATLTNNLTFPGLNPIIEQFNAIETDLMGKVKTLSSATDGIAGQISSIKTQVDTKLGSLKDQFGSMLSELEIPTASLQEDIFNAMASLSTNPTGFVSEMSTIAAKFPSVDMNSIVSKFSDSTFSIVKDIPNMKIINGLEVLKALPELKPTLPVEIVPDYEVVDAAEAAELETRVQVMTDRDKESFDALVARASASEIFPTGLLENLRSSMEAKIRDTLQDKVKLTESLDRIGRDVANTGTEIATKFANEKRLFLTMVGRTRDRNLESGPIETINSDIPESEAPG